MTPSFWPTPQDYNESIQSPHIFIGDAELASGIVETNALGLPKSMTGAFASVYKITVGKSAWAVRCFLVNRVEQRERYQKVSEFVLIDDLECTIDFHYLENGIKIKGEWFPLVKMPWVEGDTLDQYVLRNYQNTETMRSLLVQFHGMMDDLKRAGISHGDLQHGNILVTTDGLRLVDYDALFVPALAGKQSLELGHPNYQHPSRNSKHYDKDVDNFSAWLLHTAILSIAIDPVLYEEYCDGDDSLLFRRSDLANPEESKLFTALLNHSSSHITEAAMLIQKMLWADPGKIPALNAPESILASLPHSREERVLIEVILTEEDCSITNSPDFSFIEDDAALIRAARPTVQSKSAVMIVQEHLQARWDGFQLWFAPTSFIEKKLIEAQRIFDRGDYDEALVSFQMLYKVIETTKQTEPESYFLCLFRLGCCYKASATPALASNYFLLSLQNAKNYLAARPAIYLALQRYQTEDKAGAFKLLKEHQKKGELPKLIKTEIRHHLLEYLPLFELLVEFCEQLLDGKERGMAADVVSSAWSVLREADRTKSLALTDAMLDRIIGLLARVDKNESVVGTYEDMAQYLKSIGKPNKSTIALINACVLDLRKLNVRESENLVDAIFSMAQLGPGEEELTLLSTSIMASGPPEHVRDVFVILAERLQQLQASEVRAVQAMRIACEVTAKSELTIPYELIAVLQGLNNLSNCVTPSMENPKFANPLISNLAHLNDLSTLVKLANAALKEGHFSQLSRILIIVRYTCPEELFFELCDRLKLPLEETNAAITSNLDALSSHLRRNKPKKRWFL